MNAPFKREDWPHWMQRLRMPFRFISGRVQDVQMFARIYSLGERNHWFHYSSPGHVESVTTIWPFLFIESRPGDDIADFLARKVLAGVEGSGNSAIHIPRSVLMGEPFPIEVSLVASTLIEMAHRKERETRRSKTKRVKVEQLPI